MTHNNTRELPSAYQLIPQWKLYKPEGNVMMYLKWWKGRIYNQEYSTFRYGGEIKTCPYKQRLKEFSTTKPALQQMLKQLF